MKKHSGAIYIKKKDLIAAVFFLSATLMLMCHHLSGEVRIEETQEWVRTEKMKDPAVEEYLSYQQ